MPKPVHLVRPVKYHPRWQGFREKVERVTQEVSSQSYVWSERVPDPCVVHQTSIDGAAQGSCDEYSATAAYQVRCALGSKTLAAGNHKFRFTVTGKNTASAGYTLNVDKIVLQR